MYISVKLIDKLFKCNLKHMLQGHPCHVAPRVLSEIDELRVKFALYVENISNETVIKYLNNNSLIPEFLNFFRDIKSKIDKMPKKEQLGYIKQLDFKDKIIEIKKRFPANQTEIEKINHIYNIFNSSLLGIQSHEACLEKNFLTYNYKQISDEIENLETNYLSKDFSIFKKAFLNYKIGNYVQAYYELDKVAYEAGKNKNYLIHVFASSYQYYLGQFIDNYYDFVKNYSQEIKNIIDEYKRIDVQDLINRYIHKDFKDIVKSMVDLSFYKDVSSDIRRSNDDILKMYNTAKKGSWGFSNSLTILYERINDLYCFITCNYTMPTEMYECSEAFRQFIKSILCAYAVNNIAINKKNSDFIYSGGMSCFDLFDFFIMIEYGKINDIQSICKEYKITEFTLENNSIRNDLLDIFKNFYENLKNGYKICNYSEKMKILLFIFAKVHWEQEEVKYIVNYIIKILKLNLPFESPENYNFQMAKNKMFSNLIRALHNKTYEQETIFDPIQLCDLITILLNDIRDFDYDRAEATDYLKIIYELTAILLLKHKKVKFNNSNKIIELLIKIKDLKLKVFLGSRLYKMLTPKKQIRKEIYDCFNKLKDGDFLETVRDLLESGIITPNMEIQNKILILAQESLILQANNSNTYYGADPLFSSLGNILYLLRTEQWRLYDKLELFIKNMNNTYKNKFKNRENWWKKHYVDFLNVFTLYTNINLVNFRTINFKLFSEIDDSLLFKIKTYINNNPSIKKDLAENMLSSYEDNKDLNDKMLSILFE